MFNICYLPTHKKVFWYRTEIRVIDKQCKYDTSQQRMQFKTLYLLLALWGRLSKQAGVYGYSSFKFPILAYVCHSGPNFAGWVFSAEMSLWNELLKEQPLLEFSVCLWYFPVKAVPRLQVFFISSASINFCYCGVTICYILNKETNRSLLCINRSLTDVVYYFSSTFLFTQLSSLHFC